LPEAAETFSSNDSNVCLSEVVHTTVDVASSHAVHVTLTMPESVDDVREWIFTASGSSGGEQWMWWPMDDENHIKFGVWGQEDQRILEFEGSDNTQVEMLDATSLATVYDADTSEYKLYMNGELKNSISGVQFQPDEMKLYLGVVPTLNANHQWTESSFTGCIKNVEIFDRALSDSEVQALD